MEGSVTEEDEDKLKVTNGEKKKLKITKNHADSKNNNRVNQNSKGQVNNREGGEVEEQEEQGTRAGSARQNEQPVNTPQQQHRNHPDTSTNSKPQNNEQQPPSSAGKAKNVNPQGSALSYMGYSNLNQQDSDEERDFRPQNSTPSGTKRSRREPSADSDSEDSSNNSKKSSKRHENHSRKRVRKSSKSKKKKKSVKKSKEKLPEDGVLAIEKFLLKRYNTNTKQCEYLVHWNGFDIHRSSWLAKHDIFAAEYLNEFEEEWANRLKERKENPPVVTDPKAPMQYAVGDKVWVKLKGYQWWPAQIVVRSEIDQNKTDYTVVFYGDNTFAFVNDYDTKDFSIEPFEPSSVEKYVRKQNEKAIKEALAMLPTAPE